MFSSRVNNLFSDSLISCFLSLISSSAFTLNSLISFFAWRGYLAAFKCPNRFAAYGTFGIITIIVIQSLLHCMVVAGVAPSTGLPLPFFSKGGSSELMVLTMCGFVLNTSRCEEKSLF